MKQSTLFQRTTTPKAHLPLAFLTTLLATLTLLSAQPAPTQAQPHPQAQTHPQAQQPQIAVNVEPRIIQTGGRLTYTIDVITQNNLQINLAREPDFGDLQVVGRMTAPQFILRNGTASRQLTVTYTLAAPQKPGTHRIEPPIVEVGPSRYTPVSLDVKILNRADLPAPEPRTDQDLYLDVTVAPERPPYVGEQILISYDLFVDTRKIQVRPRPPSEPALDAFWIEDLSEHTSGRRRAVSVGSRLLEQTPIRTFIAFPLKSGPATVDQMTIPLVRGSFFGPTSEHNLTSDEHIIDVQPLPAGAPPGFHPGNVGQWRFKTELNMQTTRVGDSIDLTLTANGRGRASQLRFDPLPPIEGLRLIHDTTDATRLIQGTTLHGTRTQTITLMPLTEGEITIPSITFSYFDPETESYQTTTTQPLTLRVGPGQLPAEPEPEEQNVARTTHNPTDITTTLTDQMHPILTDYQSPQKTPAAFNWLAATPPVLGILLLLFGAPLIRRRPATRTTRKQQKALWTNVNAQIAQAESQADNPKTAYATLTAAAHTYLSTTLNVPAGALTEKELRPYLDAQNVPADLQSELFNIANICNTARFAPLQNNTQNNLLTTAQRLRNALKQLDKTLARQKTTSKTQTHATTLIFSLLLLTPSIPAFAQTTQNTQNTDWQTLANNHPNDPILQLNAGTQLAKTGDFPRARLYLERASLLDPTHPAIHQNLDLTRQIVVHNATSKRHPRFTEPLSAWQTAAAIPQSALHTTLLLTLWLAFFTLLVHRVATTKNLSKTHTTTTILLWITALTFILTATITTTRAIILQNANPAIITTDAPALREGPSTFAALLRTNNRTAPGMLVNILESRDGWLKIQIADNTHGWMQSTDILPIKN